MIDALPQRRGCAFRLLNKRGGGVVFGVKAIKGGILMSVLVGKKAPDFKVPAVVNGGEVVHDFTLSQFMGRKYVLLFFYPADFTFVCPTELHAFQDKLSAFEQRGVQLLACSVDSEFSHWKWLQTPAREGGIQGVTYPLLADQARTVSMSYDVYAGGEEWHDESHDVCPTGEPRAYRGLFLIDREGIVRHQVVNDMPLGRSVDEALRMVDALQFFEQHGEVCPANWHKGEQGLEATQGGISRFLSGRK